MTDPSNVTPTSSAPLQKRWNSLGVFSVIVGAMTAFGSTWFFFEMQQDRPSANPPGGFVAGMDFAARILVPLGIAAIIATLGLVGGLAGLLGLIHRPRGAGLLGVLLNFGVPLGWWMADSLLRVP